MKYNNGFIKGLILLFSILICVLAIALVSTYVQAAEVETFEEITEETRLSVKGANKFEGFVQFDIPMSLSMQRYTYSRCEEYNVPYELILALIELESEFNDSLISDTNDYGLTQINIVNHKHLSGVLGVTDFLNPRQNILCGIYMLSNLINKYGDTHKALMAYNMGEVGAERLWSKGIPTSPYSRIIIENMTRYRNICLELNSE